MFRFATVVQRFGLVLTILFGVFPKPVLDMSAASVATLIENYGRALGAAKSAALLP